MDPVPARSLGSAKPCLDEAKPSDRVGRYRIDDRRANIIVARDSTEEVHTRILDGTDAVSARRPVRVRIARIAISVDLQGVGELLRPASKDQETGPAG